MSVFTARLPQNANMHISYVCILILARHGETLYRRTFTTDVKPHCLVHPLWLAAAAADTTETWSMSQRDSIRIIRDSLSWLGDRGC